MNQGWFVSQIDNFDDAMAQGAIWTCPHPHKEIKARLLIKELQPDDLLFHYGGHPHAIRAVSRVTDSWKGTPRPDLGYPRSPPDEPDDGWEVRIQTVVTGFTVSHGRLAALIRHGDQGPLTSTGEVARGKFLSPLSETDVFALSLAAGLAPEDLGDPTRMGETTWLGTTDGESMTLVRREQGALRRRLLGDATDAACALCGRVLPRQLLVAGHIKPRALCSEEERSDFANAAMLICLMGCDALFEHGYIVVNSGGYIAPGVLTSSAEVAAAVDRLAGRKCVAYTPGTAPRFWDHRLLCGLAE